MNAFTVCLFTFRIGVNWSLVCNSIRKVLANGSSAQRTCKDVASTVAPCVGYRMTGMDGSFDSVVKFVVLLILYVEPAYAVTRA